ncbi:hypothetical protein M0R45_021558 [Rubus argutus]|uniref:Transmembrane protein n=1 Tax=Rubus argutus TaxID=59490 RepID=A0AAW1XF95_RUBAR
MVDLNSRCWVIEVGTGCETVSVEWFWFVSLCRMMIDEGKGHGLGMVVKCIGCGLIWMMKVGPRWKGARVVMFCEFGLCTVQLRCIEMILGQIGLRVGGSFLW